jgi:hypothetical protein
MNSQATESLRRHRWRLVLLLLVVVALLPEVAIYFATTLAKIKGCQVKVPQETGCTVCNISLNDIIFRLFTLGVWIAGSAAPVVWLAPCYLAIARGWQRLVSRLLLGLVVALIVATLYYPVVSIVYDTTPNDLMVVIVIALFAFLANAVLAVALRLYSVWRPTE